MSDQSLALRFQFETESQQRRAAHAGMWFFLATELMMFGGLFTSYTVYRIYYPAGFAAGSNMMDVVLGTVNTLILISSSFTMAMAVSSAEHGKSRGIVLFLGLTVLLGGIFLGIKFYEYYHHWQEATVPGIRFHETGPLARQVGLFFWFYFMMTGLHAFHMIVGIGIITVIGFRAALGVFSEEYYTPVEITGLYWHFVDIIWVFLFALFYLVGRHIS